MSKYNAAYINALSEERDPKILFEWIVKLHKENVDLGIVLNSQNALKVAAQLEVGQLRRRLEEYE